MSIRYFVAFFGILLLGSYPGRSAVTDLRITEVDPLGDWVEITHFSDMAFVNGATRGFCKRFNYANSINIGESFGARESKTFNISLHDTLSDVWLYVGTAGFGQDAGGEVYFCVSATGGPTGTSGVVYKIIPLIGLNDIDIAGADAVLEVVRDSSVSGVSVEASTDPADPASWSGKAASVVSVQPGVDEARVTRNGGSENYRVRGP